VYKCSCGEEFRDQTTFVEHVGVKAKKMEEFQRNVVNLLQGKAEQKGYNDTGPDGYNLLFDFVHKMGLTHAEGEVVYKIVRWHNQHNPEDLEKAAAWCALIWLHGRER